MSSYRTDIKTTKCPRCTNGRIMTGRHAEFNGRAKDGTQVCPDCIVREVRESVLAHSS